jgi:hypothetical protein
MIKQTDRQETLYKIMTQLYVDYTGFEIAEAVGKVRQDLNQIQLMKDLEENVKIAILKRDAALKEYKNGL